MNVLIVGKTRKGLKACMGGVVLPGLGYIVWLCRAERLRLHVRR